VVRLKAADMLLERGYGPPKAVGDPDEQRDAFLDALLRRAHTRDGTPATIVREADEVLPPEKADE
jgi:hypothetical protein